MSGWRLIAAICVTMTAFAGNSLLNRVAVDAGHAGAFEFAALRVLAGAAMLGLLVAARGVWHLQEPIGLAKTFAPQKIAQAAWLTLYLLGFSLAYIVLDAGLGALVLFGGVQVTMFAAALSQGEPIAARRWIGVAAAIAGLVVLLRPAESGAADWGGVLAMMGAALGWGLYSVSGRSATDPLLDTALSFALAAPVCLAALALWLGVNPVQLTWAGIWLACLSGAVTSGLGYALWYAILPRIAASSAALVQLSAPFLAVLGGVVLLGEALSPRLGIAGGLILGGIAFGLSQRRIGSSGS